MPDGMMRTSMYRGHPRGPYIPNPLSPISTIRHHEHPHPHVTQTHTNNGAVIAAAADTTTVNGAVAAAADTTTANAASDESPE